MAHETYKHVFGPALSRRLGRSLGIDVLPFKTCTYDCVYCQLGRTTNRTVARREYVPLDEVFEEVRRKLDSGVEMDYVSIVGSGEPTLYSKLGALIAGIKAMTDTPVAVITNGSLLWRDDVVDDVLDADLVIPSLDAGNAAMFTRVNRPDPAIGFEEMVDGLAAFRERYEGQVWLEVFLLGDVAATDEAVAELAGHIARIRPGKVQLNTVARPTPGTNVRPVPRQELDRIASRIGANAEVAVEPIAHYDDLVPTAASEAGTEEVLGVLRRHPCTLEDIAAGLGLHPPEALKHVTILLERGAITAESKDGATFYVATQD